MRILILSWRGPMHPNAGGAEIMTHEHAKAWASSGHEVTLFTSAFPGFPAEDIIDGVKIIRRGGQILSVQCMALFWYLFGSHPKYDLVVDQFHGIPFFTTLYVRTKKLALIHEVAKEVWWTNHLRFPLNRIYGAIGIFFEPIIFLLYRYVKFITVSDSTKVDLINWGIKPGNISVIHNGITKIPVHCPKEKIPTVIFLGALAKDKGIEDALKTFALLHKTNSDWKFWIVGKGDANYLKSLNIPPYIHNWGFVTESKKFELLAKAHVLINPSYREGWGLVNIEANSVGTPIVAYDVPGCRDSIKDFQTGFLCPKGDIDCMSEKITTLINDQSLYKQFSESAKSWSNNFSWLKATDMSLKYIENI